MCGGGGGGGGYIVPVLKNRGKAEECAHLETAGGSFDCTYIPHQQKTGGTRGHAFFFSLGATYRRYDAMTE